MQRTLTMQLDKPSTSNAAQNVQKNKWLGLKRIADSQDVMNPFETQAKIAKPTISNAIRSEVVKKGYWSIFSEENSDDATSTTDESSLDERLKRKRDKFIQERPG